MSDTEEKKRKRNVGAEDTASEDDSEGSESPEESESVNKPKKHDKKKHKNKHKKEKSKKQKLDKEAKRQIKEAKRFLKQKLVEGTTGGPSVSDEQPPSGDVKVVPISQSDYFSRNGEYSCWLLESKKKYFNDLTSEESHELFDEFVEKWNAGKLASKYYKGMSSMSVRRTNFKWGIKGGGAGRAGDAIGLAAAQQEDPRIKGKRGAGGTV